MKKRGCSRQLTNRRSSAILVRPACLIALRIEHDTPLTEQILARGFGKASHVSRPRHEQIIVWIDEVLFHAQHRHAGV